MHPCLVHPGVRACMVPTPPPPLPFPAGTESSFLSGDPTVWSYRRLRKFTSTYPDSYLNMKQPYNVISVNFTFQFLIFTVWTSVSHSCHCSHFHSEILYYSFMEVNRAVQWFLFFFCCFFVEKYLLTMWNVTDESHLPISLQSIQRPKHILQYHRVDHLNISVAINYLCQDGDSDGGWNAEVHNTAPRIMILNDQISDTSLLRLYSYKEIPSLLSAGFEMSGSDETSSQSVSNFCHFHQWLRMFFLAFFFFRPCTFSLKSA